MPVSAEPLYHYSKMLCPQDIHILFVGDMPSAHGFQVGSLKLAVYQFAAMFLKMLRQTNQCYLRRTRHKGEHTLAKESAIEVNAIQSACKFAVHVPHFHTVCDAPVMQ